MRIDPEDEDVAAYERTLPELRCAHDVYVADCPHCSPDRDGEQPEVQRGRYVY